ncbi:MAG: transcriptional regulator [Acidobacteria bacterium]|nr:MAG: transcriptional regulator [Acidobacteriota bacterium]
MKNNDFDLLVASIKEAGDIKTGKTKPSRFFEMNAPDIKAIRQSLKMSQREFALMIGVSVRTLQNWEQGRREPDGPAKALLRVASMNPRAVIEALHVD